MESKPDGYVACNTGTKQPLLKDDGVFYPGPSAIRVYRSIPYELAPYLEWVPVKLVYLDEEKRDDGRKAS